MSKLLEVKNLSTSFFTKYGEIKAVNNVSFDLDEGEVLAIVGESGSGKSVTAFSIMQLIAKGGRVVNGELRFVIMTRPAGPALTGIHPRQPVIALEEQVKPYLADYQAAREIMAAPGPELCGGIV